jgi:hypothetical protein
MDYEEYCKAYFREPMPNPQYKFGGFTGLALFIEDFDAAVEFYQQVLGPPAYAKGSGTRGWRIGTGWLTLLRGKSGAPQNVEVILDMETPEEAERLQNAFIKAGGEGPAPSNQLMYEPIRSCPVCDPFGTNILIISSLEDNRD